MQHATTIPEPLLSKCLSVSLITAVFFLTGCQVENRQVSEASFVLEQTYSPADSFDIEAAPGLSNPADEAFGDYWYQGEAEISSYNLDQPRYGEMRRGEAVLIFVTEDLSKSKQVKLDNPTDAGDDAVKVMKLNFSKKFSTGIYPYSMMSSVFTPVYGNDHPRTLKVTTSSQEWCGHAFTQINLTEKAYRIQQQSYFESEGDRIINLDPVLLEDEIWNRIRLNPGSLPTGNLRVIPGTLYQRLAHSEWKAFEAKADLESIDENRKAYRLTYPELDRTLIIRFDAASPYQITGWEETYPSGRGPGARMMTTRARLDKSIMLDYWNRNSTSDATLRADLNLD